MVELELSRTGEQRRRDEACPYDDCSERYTTDDTGKVTRIDPHKTVASALESQRFQGFSVAMLRQFLASRYVAPHFLVGFGRLSRELSFDFDDPGFQTRTYLWKTWGPVGGVGLDVVAGRLVVRVQYRVDTMFVGQECAVLCNDQFRIGAGWAF